MTDQAASDPWPMAPPNERTVDDRLLDATVRVEGGTILPSARRRSTVALASGDTASWADRNYHPEPGRHSDRLAWRVPTLCVSTLFDGSPARGDGGLSV